eukprot:6196409-Pleurochrysis_carterae.AAC.1
MQRRRMFCARHAARTHNSRPSRPHAHISHPLTGSHTVHRTDGCCLRLQKVMRSRKVGWQRSENINSSNHRERGIDAGRAFDSVGATSATHVCLPQRFQIVGNFAGR